MNERAALMQPSLGNNDGRRKAILIAFSSLSPASASTSPRACERDTTYLVVLHCDEAGATPRRREKKKKREKKVGSMLRPSVFFRRSPALSFRFARLLFRPSSSDK